VCTTVRTLAKYAQQTLLVCGLRNIVRVTAKKQCEPNVLVLYRFVPTCNALLLETNALCNGHPVNEETSDTEGGVQWEGMRGNLSQYNDRGNCALLDDHIRHRGDRTTSSLFHCPTSFFLPFFILRVQEVIRLHDGFCDRLLKVMFPTPA
jgi:hypothetical protein